ncbi:hypothetical protein B0H11DRAFT_2282534 [Mycena galericulata]|nr:hypothetical protein B0H11DRAFT_2282534 [Mycena galericulata]
MCRVASVNSRHIRSKSAEKRANQVDHHLGMGPNAGTQRIHDSLGMGSNGSRDRELGEIRFRKLEKDCARLMKYALPPESQRTKLQAFKNLFMLTTRYPGLRRLFLVFLDSQQVRRFGRYISALGASGCLSS